MAKEVIQLIYQLGQEIDKDPVISKKLKVLFLESYRVSMAEHMMPATDISEQISLAGKEASGTGNMKLMINGAVTIGTLDGANVEMRDAVGDDNIFIFGLNADEVAQKKAHGYNSFEYYNSNPILHRVMHTLGQETFADGKTYQDIGNSLLYGQGFTADDYLLLADFESYRQEQQKITAAYGNQKHWNQMALVNIAKSGKFAADRSIRDYARNIWHVPTRL